MMLRCVANISENRTFVICKVIDGTCKKEFLREIGILPGARGRVVLREPWYQVLMLYGHGHLVLDDKVGMQIFAREVIETA